MSVIEKFGSWAITHVHCPALRSLSCLCATDKQEVLICGYPLVHSDVVPAGKLLRGQRRDEVHVKMQLQDMR